MNLSLKNTWTFECYSHWIKFNIFNKKIRLFKRLKWKETIDNIVVTAGLNKVLDATFKTGLSTPAWYVGLKNTGSPAAGDTMSSHAGWTENTSYDEANRPAFTPGTISNGSVDNS